MEELGGKVAVVTGGASGIGLGFARRFGAEGMKVVIADVEEEALSAAEHELRDRGIETLAVKTDVSQFDSVQELADRTFSRFGTAHVLCNNAGVGPGGITWDLPQSVWDWVLGVDLFGVVHGIRAFVPRLVEQGEGHVVNTASYAGLFGSAGNGPYCAAKFAVVGLSQVLYRDLELAHSPVGVTVVCPVLTKTRMNDSGRNWPTDRLGPAPVTGLQPSHPETRHVLYQGMDSAMETSDLAELVLDAILHKLFWVVPHAELEQRLRTYVDGIVEGTLPPIMR